MVITLCFQAILALDARHFNHPEPRWSGTSEPFSSTPHGSQTGAGFRCARAKAGARLAQWNAQDRAVWFRFPIWTGSRQLASGPTFQEIADADFEAI